LLDSGLRCLLQLLRRRIAFGHFLAGGCLPLLLCGCRCGGHLRSRFRSRPAGSFATQTAVCAPGAEVVAAAEGTRAAIARLAAARAVGLTLAMAFATHADDGVKEEENYESTMHRQ
jgi:hypothetical protein